MKTPDSDKNRESESRCESHLARLIFVDRPKFPPKLVVSTQKRATHLRVALFKLYIATKSGVAHVIPVALQRFERVDRIIQ